jgi:hypothetical protein
VKNRISNAAAFSLAEVMVASAVLSIVMAILLGTLTTSMSLWRNTENKLSADREGRAIELLIAQDLSTVVMGTNPNFWPRVQNDVLQFLTTKPKDYQFDPADKGDVCYVEYFLSPEKDVLFRTYYGSAWTYANVLQAGQFRSAPDLANGDVLATNLLASMADSVRGLGYLPAEIGDKPFITLGTNGASGGNARDVLPHVGAYDFDNPPVAIEVNVAVADPEVIENKDLLNDPNYRLRNAGYYSFRVSLPPPRPTP